MLVMHKIQRRLLDLADTKNLGDYSYYALAKKLGVPNHGSIKFHMDQLLQKGLLFEDPNTGEITKISEDETFTGLIHIPVMGQADCGAATKVADNTIESFLAVSKSLLPKASLEKIYALKAVGQSMNRASVNGKPINHGDYVIIEDTDSVNSGDYIVSIIDSVANIKKLLIDGQNSRLVLSSESSESFTPIFIHEEDQGVYELGGRVVDVVPGVPA